AVKSAKGATALSEEVAASARLGGASATGARILERVASQEAEAIYAWIRGLDAEANVAAVARNTGLPVWYIRKIRQHVFFEEHLLSDAAGTLVRQRFAADDMIATWWKA